MRNVLPSGKCKNMYKAIQTHAHEEEEEEGKGGTRGPLLSLPGISVLASRG